MNHPPPLAVAARIPNPWENCPAVLLVLWQTRLLGLKHACNHLSSIPGCCFAVGRAILRGHQGCQSWLLKQDALCTQSRTCSVPHPPGAACDVTGTLSRSPAVIADLAGDSVGDCAASIALETLLAAGLAFGRGSSSDHQG